MATANPFDLLGDDDNDDPSQLIAKQQQQQQKLAAKKPAASSPPPAKLPSKPLPPSQAVKEAKKEAVGAPRSGGRSGAARGRGWPGDRPNREFGGRNENEIQGGYGGSGEDGETNKSSERGRGNYGGPRPPFRDGRRGGYGNEEAGGDSERPPRRQFERRSGTGRGYDVKREGAGRGNWGTPTDEVVAQEPVEITHVEYKVLTPEKQPEQEDGVTSNLNKESPVNEEEEKEPEDKEMTLDEYQKVLEEKRKALNAVKTEARKVVADKEFESMQQLSIKKGNEDVVFIKLGSDKDIAKRKENADRDERVKKSVSINEFLKPSEGERFYSPRGRGRGRGRGDRGSYGPFTGGSASMQAAPAIEDPGQFPVLGGK